MEIGPITSTTETGALPARTGQGGGPEEASVSGKALDEEEAREIRELKKTDREVRAHEQAHLAAAGGLARGGANYTYERGPDGRNYAVAGEVSIDTSEGRTPEETLRKMQRVRAAALAPADPSAQDRRVAGDAAAKESRARSELLKNEEAPAGAPLHAVDLFA